MAQAVAPAVSRQTLVALLHFLGIDANKCADLVMTVERSTRWLALNDIQADDFRYEAAQAELAAMSFDQAWLRRLDWCELAQAAGTVIRIERRAFVRVLPVV